jgi:hypothetical protein
MTRPDPRLIVPCEVLPFVPKGSRLVYSDGEDFIASVCQKWSSPDVFLDLSAPSLRYGIPERLDALPWALAVLGWRGGTIIVDHARRGITIDGSGRATLYLEDAWPDLAGLTPDEASRAVVAAALRGGR